MRKWADRLYRHRRSALITTVFLTLFFAWQTRHLNIATYFRDLYPKNHPHTNLLDQYPQFGSPLSVRLVIQVKHGTIYNPQTLEKIQQATKLVDLVPGVDHNQIFSIASTKTKLVAAAVGGIHASHLLVGAVPGEPHDLENLRAKVRSAPQVIGFLVSSREDAALIHVTFIERIADYAAIFAAVNDIINRIRDERHDVYAAGAPILSGWIYSYSRETFFIIAATVAAMILILALHVRSIPAVATPIVVSATTAVWGIGIAATLKINFDPLVMILPMLLVARSFSHAIQACERFFEVYAQTQDQKTACIESMVSIFPPGILGILTDAAGLFVIAVAPIPVMEKIAVIAGFWALSLIPANVILTPLLLSFFRPSPMPRRIGRSVGHPPSFAPLQRTLSTALALTIRLGHGKLRWVTAATVIAVLVIAAWTARNLTVGDARSGTRLLWADSPYNLAIAKINERFAGFDILQVVLESRDPGVTVQSPAALNLMQRFQRHMELDPLVGATFSFADLVTATHRLLHDGLPKWGIVPHDERDAAMIAQLALSGTGPGESDHLFTRNLTAASINVWYKDHTNETVHAALERARLFAEMPLTDAASGLRFRLAAGSIGLITAINDTVARAQVEILLLVTILVFVMCALAYKSLLAAVLLLATVSFSNVLATALMVAWDIGLDVNTLPVLAVGTGIGIDYAIYLMSRVCEEFQRRHSYEDAVGQAIRTTGRAIFLTGSALVIGMVPWCLFSSLRFQAEIAVLIIALMAINMIAALIIVPLLIMMIQPKFIARRAGLMRGNEP